MTAPKQRSNQELEQQVIELEETVDGLRRLVRSLIAGQEEETRRLTRAVHQVPGQMLTQLAMLLHELKSGRAEGDETIDEAISTTRNISREVRRLCQDTYFEILQHVALDEAVGMLAEQSTRDSGCLVEFHYTGRDRPLAIDLKVGVFQIIRRALTLADSVKGVKTLVLDVNDQGDSLVVTLASKEPGEFRQDREEVVLVLPWLEERAAMLGGEFRNDSTDRDLRLRVRIPVSSAA